MNLILDTPITIDVPSEEVGAMGDVTTTWVTIGPIWADHRNLTGRELIEAKQLVAEVDSKFVIRYSAQFDSVNAKCRLTRGSRVHDILCAIPQPGGRPNSIEIFCKRRAD